jgi:hypothetical protein
MLQPYHEIYRLFQHQFFWILLVVSVVLTCGVNYGIDYGMNKDKDVPIKAADGNLLLNILIFTLIVGLITFFGSGSIHQRIRQNLQPPVAQVVLCDTLFKRIVFFSWAIPSWKDRLPRFLCQILFFPGIAIVILTYIICWFASHRNGVSYCEGDVYFLCNFNMFWKGVTTGLLFALNYVAAHNDAQPELSEGAGVYSPLVDGGYADGLSTAQQTRTADLGKSV